MTVFDNINDELKNKELNISAVDTGEVGDAPQTTGGTEVSGANVTQTPDNGKGYTVSESQLLADKENKPKVNPGNELRFTKVVNTPNGKVSVSPYIDPGEDKIKPQTSQVNLTGDSNAQIEESLEKQPMYLADWEKEGAKGILNGRASVRDSIQDYFKWCKDNDVKPDVQGLWMYAENQDLKKSGHQNAVDEKKQKRYERNEQLGNFFMHLGDFVGSVGWGGPEQKIEDSKELTARQKKMRDAVEAKRDNYNTKFMNMMLKQKQMEDDERKMAIAEKKQEQAEELQEFRMDIEKQRANLQHLQYLRAVEQDKVKQGQIEAQIENTKQTIKQKEKELQERIRSNKANERLRGESNEIARKNKNKGGGGSKGSSGSKDYTVTTYDDHGNIKGTSVHQQGTHIPSSSSNKGPKRDASGKKRINK